MYRYLFIAVLAGSAGYCWGLVEGVHVVDQVAGMAGYQQ